MRPQNGIATHPMIHGFVVPLKGSCGTKNQVVVDESAEFRVSVSSGGYFRGKILMVRTQNGALSYSFFYAYIYIYMLAPPPRPIFWLLGRYSCVKALFSMLMWRSYRNSEDILTPWQMFMCQGIVFHVDHHLTSSVHIIPFSFWKKSCFTESLFVDIEILPRKLLPFEKIRSSKKEGYFALKKVRSSTQRNVFSVCINWTFLNSPFFEEQFILYHS